MKMESIPYNLDKSFEAGASKLPGLAPSPDTRRADRSEEAGRRRAEAARAQEQKRPEPSSEAPKVDPPRNSAVTFRLNQEAERFYIQVVDRSTGEVLRQIPSDQMLKLAAALQRATGNLLDTSA